MLTGDQALAKPDTGEDYAPTVARGSFMYGNRGHVIGPAMSAADRETQVAAGTKTGAHAEEMVVAMFKQIWVDALGRPNGLNIDIELDVNRSSCINCASYIAGFITELKSAGCRVNARIHFSQLYKATKPQRVSGNVMAAEGDIIRKFLDQSRIVKSSQAGRHWGATSTTADPRQRTKSWNDLKGGKVEGDYQNAKAAIGILLNAGAAVSAVGLDRLDPDNAKEMTAADRADLAARNQEVLDAVAMVDKVLASS